MQAATVPRVRREPTPIDAGATIIFIDYAKNASALLMNSRAAFRISTLVSHYPSTN